MIGQTNDAEVMFDHDKRVTGITKLEKEIHQALHAEPMQSGGWLVQKIQGLARLLAAQLKGQLQPLSFPPESVLAACPSCR